MKDFAKSVRTNNEIRGPHSMITAEGRINYSGSDMAEITMLEKELKGLMDMAKKDKANDYSYQIRELQKEIAEKKKKRTIGNSRTDITYKGRALTDDEIRKLTPSQKSEIMREYERMVRSGAISDSEMAEAMDEIGYFGRIGNSKVGNSNTFDRLDDAIHYASNLTDNALRRLSSPYSATNIVSDLSKCKQACDEAIKLAIQYDKEQNK